MKPTKDSLVLYKQSPALVTASEDKIDILLPGGNSRRVREKDIHILHPGPVANFPNLETGAPEGQPEEAWELLQGENPTLKDLAEIVYGDYTPTTSWLAFTLLNRSPWFRGTVDAVEVADPQSVAARIKADQEKAIAEERWKDFIGRFIEGKIDKEKDEPFLRDLEMFALGKSKGSRVLKAIGKAQTPENAHRVMIAKNIKDIGWNPHPLRLGISTEAADFPLGEFPTDEERLNLSAMEAFAIDDEDNQDPDDAISWDAETLWVHVADVAALIPADSPADQAVRERASSLYLPEKTIPMLPREATARLGLGLQKSSPALSYAFKCDSEGKVIDFSIHLSNIRVTRLSYAEANERIHEQPFLSMNRAARVFRTQREAAGAINIRMPEVKVKVDEKGEIHIHPLPDLASRHLVAEAMLMAGSYAANWCLERNISVPFTVQESSGETTESAEGDSADYLTQYKLRRGMKRSRTTLECSAHSGLGLKAYTRVTSPLRRYPDLLASRQIRASLQSRACESAESILKGLAAYENRIGSLIQAERKSNLFWKIQWLSRRPGFRTEAIIVDRLERQGYFLLPEIAMEIRVPLKKDIELGSRVILKLKEVDIAEPSALFVIQEFLE